MAFSEEIIVPFAAEPSRLPPVSRCKSTLIVSSVRTLQDVGLHDRYLALLDPSYRDVITSTVAGVWLPIDVGIAHYEACEALGLSPSEQLRIGGLVAERVHKSMLSTIVRVASSTGVTPWTGLMHFHRFYERVFEGGGTRIVKLGPKDARIEVVGLPLARIPYFVTGYRGVIAAGSELFVQRAIVTTLARYSGPTTIAFRVAWV